MSDKKFISLLLIIAVLGIVLTAVHAAYIYRAYINSSIIYFISREIWL